MTAPTPTDIPAATRAGVRLRAVTKVYGNGDAAVHALDVVGAVLKNGDSKGSSGGDA